MQRLPPLLGICLACGERCRLGCTGRRPADRTVCSARAPNTAREARALPTHIPDGERDGVRGEFHHPAGFHNLVETTPLPYSITHSRGAVSGDRPQKLFTTYASTMLEPSAPRQARITSAACRPRDNPFSFGEPSGKLPSRFVRSESNRDEWLGNRVVATRCAAEIAAASTDASFGALQRKRYGSCVRSMALTAS